MKLLLNINGHDKVMHVKFYLGASVIAELLPFDCLNINVFFYPQLFFGCFYLILYVPSTTFQLYRDGSSWIEPELS